MQRSRKKERRALRWILGSGGITSGILARAQNLVDFLGLANVADDINAWKSLIARLFLFVSQLDWGERIFNALFLVFVGLFVWTVWCSRRKKYRRVSDDEIAANGKPADPDSGVVTEPRGRQSSCLICVESNATVVLDMLKSMLLLLDPAYREIHSTVSYDDETKKEKAREASWTAHDKLEGIVRKLRGYIEDSFDRANLLPWWHDLGRTLGQLSFGQLDFRDEVKKQLKSRRSELLSWIEVVDEMHR